MAPFHCPHCGSAEVQYQEPVWTRRNILQQQDGVLYVDGLASPIWDASLEDMAILFCMRCFTETPITDYDIEFV
jgi:hypothetical protein